LTAQSTSAKIREQLKSSGTRYWAGDNISQFITDDVKAELITEATAAFESVLDTLLIDR